MKKKIGIITLGEKAFLSDACYGTICKGNCTIDTIPGEYIAFITRSESKSPYIGGRISNLFVVHKDFYPTYKKMPKNDKEMLFCGVDSGTCGIYDEEYYRKYHTENEVDDDWYEKNVIEMEEFNITDNLGVISRSGCGDGLYPVYADYKDGKAFALRVNFL